MQLLFKKGTHISFMSSQKTKHENNSSLGTKRNKTTKYGLNLYWTQLQCQGKEGLIYCFAGMLKGQ